MAASGEGHDSNVCGVGGNQRPSTFSTISTGATYSHSQIHSSPSLLFLLSRYALYISIAFGKF